MKQLEKCANGDGRPVKPPSLVICAECQAQIRANLVAMIDRLKALEAAQ